MLKEFMEYRMDNTARLMSDGARNILALFLSFQMSRIMRKLVFCLSENKGADQLRSNCEADQRLCFRYTDNTILLLLKSEISSFYPFPVASQDGLCQTWSETPKTGSNATLLQAKSSCKVKDTSCW